MRINRIEVFLNYCKISKIHCKNNSETDGNLGVLTCFDQCILFHDNSCSLIIHFVSPIKAERCNKIMFLMKNSTLDRFILEMAIQNMIQNKKSSAQFEDDGIKRHSHKIVIKKIVLK